jgi:hypothetical protein
MWMKPERRGGRHVDVRITIGPVDAGAARLWSHHLLANLTIVKDQVERLPFRLPADVIDDFAALLSTWVLHAEGDVFLWSDDLDEDRVRNLVRYWANLDSLGDEVVVALGLTWAPAEARPFFDALARGVADGLASTGTSDPFAELLVVHGRRPVRDVGAMPSATAGSR